MTSSHEVSFADNFEYFARRSSCDYIGGLGVVDSDMLSEFRRGNMIAVILRDNLTIAFSPKWLPGMKAILEEKKFHNFGDLVGWIYYYFDYYNCGNDMIESMQVVNSGNNTHIHISLAGSIRTFSYTMFGTFDVSRIPDEIEYERKS